MTVYTNSQQDKFKKLDDDIKTALFEYETYNASGEHEKGIVHGVNILRYAKQGLLKDREGNILMFYKSTQAYQILRLVKAGNVMSNVKEAL